MANTWTQRANLPAADNVLGSAVINGKLGISGGGNPLIADTSAGIAKQVRKPGKRSDATNARYIYNPDSDSWAIGPTLYQARAFPA